MPLGYEESYEAKSVETFGRPDILSPDSSILEGNV